jgi:hypothetical protein
MIRRVCFALILVCLCATSAWAQLTPTQLQTLKTDIAANANVTGQPGSIYQNTAVNAVPNNSDGNFAIAFWYNQATVGFIVWRNNVPVYQVGNAMLQTDIANLTATNLSRLQVDAGFYTQGFTGSANTEAGFNDIFSVAGASGTRANLHIVWRRVALRNEQLFATGTGSDASPATMGHEGTISGSDVQNARSLP